MAKLNHLVCETPTKLCRSLHSPVTPELMVEFGMHGETILRVARTLKTDLVIMGLNHSKHGLAISHLPQTTTYHVVTAAHCPVLTVRY